MIVLLILLSMFTEMFMAVAPGTESYKDAVNALEMCSNEFCVKNANDFPVTYRDYIKKSYEMLLGDWDLDSQGLNDPPVYPIFVMFTFIITTIMLNMMIAIASDSYADAKEKGPKLFRILRLNYCVEVNQIERVLLK